MELTQVGTRLFYTKPEREKRDTAKGAVVSTIFHILLIIALVWLGKKGIIVLSGENGAGTGIGAGAAGGGGGGGHEQISILIPEPPPPPPEDAQLTLPQKVEELKPVEEIKPEELTIAKPDSTPTPPTAVASAAPTPAGGTGTGEGTGAGPGTGPGTGPGSGGGSGGGEGGGIGSGVGPGTGRGRVIAPSPEVLLVPPPSPGKVRGKTVVVRLSVDSVGTVRDAEIIPSTGDRKYDDTLKRVALGWHFKPARDPFNRPVSVLFDVTFTFGQ